MTASTTIRLGTRGSALALAQAAIVGRALAAHAIDHEIVVIETAGDVRAPATAWGEGAFVTAIEGALVQGRIDVAVHSAKDIPTDEDPRLTVAAFLTREEPRDALVLPAGAYGSLATLPAGTIIGTDSPRRTGFVRAYRPDLEVRPLHGNVDTRLRKLDESAVGALLLAAAGLIRLGWADRISELIPIEVVPPAPGQGAIAVQTRRQDDQTVRAIARIDDANTRQAVEAERAFLSATGGGCRAPIGAFATVVDDLLELVGGFATVDGRAAGLDRITGPAAQRGQLAEQLAGVLVARRAHLPDAPRVMLTRAAGDSRRLAGRLAEFGIAGLVVPAIEFETLNETPELDRALADVETFERIIVTSARGARAVGQAARRLGIDPATIRWAAVGHATERELLAHGAQQIWLPSEAHAAALARQLPVDTGKALLWARGDLADDTLVQALQARGVSVTAVTVYRTIVAPAGSRESLRAALAEGPIAAVLLASPSAARGLMQLVDNSRRSTLLDIPAVAVGPTTAAAARAAGFAVLGEAQTHDSSALAERIAELVSHVAQRRPLKR